MPVTRSSNASPPDSGVVIDQNFGPPPHRYFTQGQLVTGKEAASEPEIWDAFPFTPRTEVHATTLAAAIEYISGTKLVNLGVYSDEEGTVGSLLPGGQGSTTDIPASDECCALAVVTLPGAGVALTAGTRSWLVASPDNVNAPTFKGQWQNSTLGIRAFEEPEHAFHWTGVASGLLAAEIRGTFP